MLQKFSIFAHITTCLRERLDPVMLERIRQWGRRNWLHTGNHLGAENIAFMFSLFESCKLNDINFGDYIEDILTRLMEGGKASCP